MAWIMVADNITQTYADAEADAAPSYWGATVHAPSGLDGLNMT